MVTLTEIEVGARPSRAWVGGEGEMILLVHGGWGGAEMHWSRVWEPLARRFRVIAPICRGSGVGRSPGSRRSTRAPTGSCSSLARSGFRARGASGTPSERRSCGSSPPGLRRAAVES